MNVSLIEKQKREINRVLSTLLPGNGKPVALLDFPDHGNVGDSAIWLGEQAFLNEHASGCRLYSCALDTYSKTQLSEIVDDGTILLTGGGNLGDLWPRHQLFREQVIRDFPRNRIVQLPQSICFRDHSNVRRARKSFASHPDLIVLTRDKPSLDFAHAELEANALMCPDMAFNIGPVTPPVQPTLPCFWLTRGDKEAKYADERPAQDGLLISDWLTDELTETLRADVILNYLYRHQTGKNEKDAVRLKLSSLHPLLARERVLRGCKALARARCVVTERLHGHILCLLMNIPHTVLDTRYAKICNYIDSWDYSSPLIRVCDSGQSALDQAMAFGNRRQ